MMLCKLSLKNISKSIKDYTIYFFTLILGIAIFYVFNAIDEQTVMLNLNETATYSTELMNNALSAVSIFVSFVLAFLIIHASRFLIKRRNKEFGIYMTLGMSKRKISLILFLETLFIGILSLIIGMTIGFLLSQLMSIIVAYMFEIDIQRFEFVFSKAAFLKTLLYFSIMYLCVMLFNTYTINKCKLIDLIYSNKKSEIVILKNPWLCVVIFIISCVVLGYAYYLVTTGINHLKSAQDITIPMAMGAVSTFFIFWSLSGLLLRIFKSIKNVYYKELNCFVLRQFSNNINTTVLSMTIINLMLFVTICMLSSSLSLRNSMIKNTNSLCPTDIEITKTVYTEDDDMVTRDLSLIDELKEANIDIDSVFKDSAYARLYVIDGIDIEYTLGDYYDTLSSKFPNLTYDSLEEFMSLSDYNSLATEFGLETIERLDDEYAVVCNYKDWCNFRNESLKLNTKLTINGKEYTPLANQTIYGFYAINSVEQNLGFFVVPDEVLTNVQIDRELFTGRYNVSNSNDKQELENKIKEAIGSIKNITYLNQFAESNNLDHKSSIEYDTKTRIKEASIGIGAMATFIGLYLGIIFLISCAAILALKELSESSDNRDRYSVLRNIGADERMINVALFKQIAIFFALPLLLACIHTVPGLKFCDWVLNVIGSNNLIGSLILVAILIVIIYGGYFLVTYFSSKNIIKERTN